MAFVKRQLSFIFHIGTGSFGDTGMNVVNIPPGLRASVTIAKTGGNNMNTLDARIYGLDPTVANGVSTLGTIIGATRKNTVTVLAGDEGGVLATVFIGTIDVAWQDYNSAPDVSLAIHAYGGLYEAVAPLRPTSFIGSADVATIISSIALQMGWAFENNGVSVQLNNQYLSGTGREQALTAAANAGIKIIFDDQPNATPTIAIWPKTGARAAQAPLLSPDSGMVGYPIWEAGAITVKSIYNPSLSVSTGVGTNGLMVGGTVEVKSSIANASGQWQIFSMTHELESETPDGSWFTTVRANTTGTLRDPST